MSENKYKVVVTRASRLKLTPYTHAKGGDICVAANGNIGVKHYNEFIFLRKAEYPLMWADGLVFVFADFDEAAKWVFNGRNLEDLQGDAKDEWVNVQDVAHGGYATIVSCKHAFGGNTGDLVHRIHGGFVHGLELYAAPATYDLIVWPVNPTLGDKIEIVPA